MSEGTVGERWLAEARRLHPEMVRWRRALHERPELGHQEHWTSRFVRDQLGAMTIRCRGPIGATGLVAELGPSEGPTVMIRADFDALPIQEENDLPFKSREAGRAHLCGHDGHTAMLLGAAALLQAREAMLQCPVRLFFQHAEEVVPNGAEDFIRAGELRGVVEGYALHNHPGLPEGVVGVRAGAIMAASARFEIKVHGKGGHGAVPERAVDPIVIAAEIVTASQTVVSRKMSPFEPAVLTFGRICGGTAHNVIPDSVALTGTARSFSAASMDQMGECLAAVAEGIARAHGGSAEVHFARSTPAVINAPELAETLRAAASDLNAEVREAAPEMIAEDFGCLAQKVPCCYFFLGTRSEEKGVGASWHSPRFRFNEDVMPLGAALLARLAAGRDRPS